MNCLTSIQNKIIRNQVILLPQYPIYPPINGTNYGNNWILKDTPRASISACFLDCKMSNDGKYMCVVQISNGIYVSGDYGVSWTKTYSDATISFAYVRISPTGKYMFVSTFSSNSYYSSNYGASFTLLTIQIDLNSLSISYNDKYAFYINNYVLKYSTDFSSTWNNTAQFGTTQIFSCSITSTTGTIQVVTTNTTVYVSLNTGSTWTTTYASCVGITKCLLSSDGKYIIVFGTNTIYIGTWTSGTNYSWTAKTMTNVSNGSLSFTGQNMVAFFSNTIQYSTDYGNTWNSTTLTLNTNNSIRSIVSSLDGKYVLYSTQCTTAGYNGGYIYMSSNYGASFTLTYSGNIGQNVYPFIAISKDGYYQLCCFNAALSSIIYSTG